MQKLRVYKSVGLLGLAVCLCWRPLAAGAEAPEPMRLIDSPTAGLIDKGRFGLDLRLFPDGGILGRLNAGILKRLGIGVSYGGEQIIGDQSIDWYPRVEVALRYRLIEENKALPAFVLGYETQGYGRHYNERYQIKSKGPFLALSKNYLSALGQFGLHGGLNLSREDKGGDEDLSGWVGVDKSINEDLSLVAEYDLALNDDSDSSLGSGKGYLNLGVRGALAPQLVLGFYLKNILGNGAGEQNPSRELAVLYTEKF